MKGTGKALIGFGIGVELFTICAMMAMGTFIGFIFLLMTVIAIAFIVTGVSSINKANAAEEEERRFRELEEEHARYKATHRDPVPASRPSDYAQPPKTGEDDDWFKD